MELPEAMPRVLEKPAAPEVRASPALSLTARPGAAGVRSRKIAILVAPGVDGASLVRLHADLTDAGAVPRFVGARLGTHQASNGDPIEVDATMENSGPAVFDALVLPDGEDGVATLSRDGLTTEFIVNQYRHCKPILALGASRALLEAAGISAALPNGAPDPGVLVLESGDANLSRRFMAAVAAHRHHDRERDPSPV